ncbi:MAG: hypothetical protein ACR2J5_08425 [Geodermatophilaceae bacterium]
MTAQPPSHGQPPFQPPTSGAPFQPPTSGALYPGQQPPGQPGPQYGPPIQLPDQPQGPPRNAIARRSALWPVALGVLALIVLGASFWMGTYLAVYGRTGISFYLLIGAVAGAVAGLMAIWSETASEVRTWGSDLFGKTALGWRRIDLANLTSAAITTGRGNSSVILGDTQGRITFSGKKLGPVIDSVRRGVFEAAQQGRLVVPSQLAQVLGLPVQQGASKSGNTGTTQRVLAAVGLILVGLVIGLLTAS